MDIFLLNSQDISLSSEMQYFNILILCHHICLLNHLAVHLPLHDHQLKTHQNSPAVMGEKAVNYLHEFLVKSPSIHPSSVMSVIAPIYAVSVLTHYNPISVTLRTSCNKIGPQNKEAMSLEKPALKQSGT